MQIAAALAVMVALLGALPAAGDEAAPAGQGGVPITFTLPAAGVATIQVLDDHGEVVENVVSGQAFPAGTHTIWWRLGTLNDYWPPFAKPAPDVYEPPASWPRVAPPGTYHWRGLWHPPLAVHYLYDFTPTKRHGLAWVPASGAGGWLGNDAPPQDVIRAGETFWVTAPSETGHALLECDGEMRKVWGAGRLCGVIPQVLAADGAYVYFAGQEAQQVAVVRVDRKTKAARRVLVRTLAAGEKADIQGLAVVRGRAYLADRATNAVLVYDLSKVPTGAADSPAVLLRQIMLERPGRIRPFDAQEGRPARRLAVVSGTRVVLLDCETGQTVPLLSGLANPLGLAVDARRRLYVGEGEPLHQVKVFSAGGALQQVVGRPGRHRVGRFDAQNLESPAGLETDAAGNLWVCEANRELPRTSVWDVRGRLSNQVIGPAYHSPGGEIDPVDANRYFSRGLEFRRNPRTGKVILYALLWRSDDTTYPRFGDPERNVPVTPFYSRGRLFFAGSGAGGVCTLWLHDRDHLRPAAAFGATGDAKAPVYAWTDLNDNGRADPGETETGSLTCGGKPAGLSRAGGQARVNQAFEGALAGTGPVGPGLAFFHVGSRTPAEFPVYRLPAALEPLAGMRRVPDALLVDRSGSALGLGDYLFSLRPDGKLAWRFRSRWPGAAGRTAPLSGDEPGVLAGPTRFLGAGVVDKEVGEVFCLGGSRGATYLFTGDGLFIDRVFADARRGIPWQMDAPPADDVLRGVTLGEDAGEGSFQRLWGSDGKRYFRFVLSPGSPHGAVVELRGLERARRLPGGALNVTAEMASQARRP